MRQAVARFSLDRPVGTDRLRPADCGTTALIVAHIAEFIARKLYLEDGYASMYDYCVGELRMSEDIACRRIRAARAARRFPLIFPALADGRLHLTAVSLLAPHLTEESAEQLLVASFHKTKREIKVLIAGRFPQPDLPTFIASLGTAPATRPVPVAACPIPQPTAGPSPVRAAPVIDVCTSPGHSSAPARMDGPVIAVVTPLSPGRFGWQLTVDQEAQGSGCCAGRITSSRPSAPSAPSSCATSERRLASAHRGRVRPRRPVSRPQAAA